MNDFVLRARYRLATQLIEYYAGLNDTHPLGRLSGDMEFLPAMLTSNTWDVRPVCWEYSEFNYCGSFDI